MIKAIIFDLDGTIADTISAIREGLNMTMREYGFPEHTYGEVLGYVNNGARELIRRAIPEEFRQDDRMIDNVKATYDTMYAKTYHLTDKPYDGIPDVFRSLRAAGFRLAVLSNKQHEFVAKLCSALLPEGSFEIACGQREGYPTKPDPTVPHLIADALSAKPSECAFIGDSDVDVGTAKNAGMFSVGVSWGFGDPEELRALGADLIVATPGDITDFFVKSHN